MDIRIEQKDYNEVNISERSQQENPIVRAVKRAIRNTAPTAGRISSDWVVGKMPVFNENNLRAGLRMPELYVISQNDPLTTDFYVLPPAAQIFLQQWFAGTPVHPIKFELPIPEAKPETEESFYPMTSRMDEGYRNAAPPEAEAYRDIESLKRGLIRFVSEGGKDFGLGPVKEGVAKLTAIGNTPVSTIGREISRVLVTPIGAGPGVVLSTMMPKHSAIIKRALLKRGALFIYDRKAEIDTHPRWYLPKIVSIPVLSKNAGVILSEAQRSEGSPK